jgi:hypothetical protein
MPKIHEFEEIFLEDTKYYVMITDLLGPSLKNILKLQPYKRFDIVTTCQIGKKMIEVIR